MHHPQGVGGRTPLHLAAAAGSTNAALRLLDEGARLDFEVLAGAAALGTKDVVVTLLARGADVNATDLAGETASEVAGDDEARALLEPTS